MTSVAPELWRTADRRRWFLIPAAALPAGPLVLVAPDGRTRSVDPARAALYEIDEREGRDWAEAELGEALGEARQRIEAKLAEARVRLTAARHAPASPESDLTADALPAIGRLLRSLPSLLRDGLSGDHARVAGATEAIGAIEDRLNAAGIKVGTGLQGFPERLAGLRDCLARRGGGDD